jgi:hypothetical protein
VEDFVGNIDESQEEVVAPPLTFTKEAGHPTDKLRSTVKKYFKALISENKRDQMIRSSVLTLI